MCKYVVFTKCVWIYMCDTIMNCGVESNKNLAVVVDHFCVCMLLLEFYFMLENWK